VKERRATSRFNLVLPVTIRTVPNVHAVGTIFVETHDISTNGFYFNIAQHFTAGTQFEFSIALPIEITGAIRASISGNARAVRVEETGENHAGHLGIGALIENYRINRAESVKP
jgi:PilZ domain